MAHVAWESLFRKVHVVQAHCPGGTHLPVDGRARFVSVCPLLISSLALVAGGVGVIAGAGGLVAGAVDAVAGGSGSAIISVGFFTVIVGLLFDGLGSVAITVG